MFNPSEPAKLTRYAIAAGFLSFGAVALFSPETISAIMVREEYQSGFPIVGLAIAALGAHAVAAGIFALCARFMSWTYVGLAAASLPILVADYWLYVKAAAFNDLILLHVGGVFAMAALCVRGFRLTQRLEHALEQPA